MFKYIFRFQSYHRRYFATELSSGWPEQIKKVLSSRNIKSPTIVQEKTIPPALDQLNLVGIARTGSGKTLAYVLPTVLNILKDRESDESSKIGPTSVVLTPTRELANQVSTVFDLFKDSISTIALTGGKSRPEQVRNLSSRPHDVFVATCGRLLDLNREGIAKLDRAKYVIIDEADRMLDMGFLPFIQSIMSKTPKNRQVLMFSATWPKEIRQLAADLMKEYEFIEVDSPKMGANPNIKQLFKVIAPHQKMTTLIDYLKELGAENTSALSLDSDENLPRVLIFANTKRVVDNITTNLWRNKFRAVSCHGDKSQNMRDNAIKNFKEKICNILVATDVAARGLDISEITHVVNFDMPLNISDYIHRIGRTARYENKGNAMTFFTDNDINLVDTMIEQLKKTKNEVPEELLEKSRYASQYGHEQMDQRSMATRRVRRMQNNYYGDDFDNRRKELHPRQRGYRELLN